MNVGNRDISMAQAAWLAQSKDRVSSLALTGTHAKRLHNLRKHIVKKAQQRDGRAWIYRDADLILVSTRPLNHGGLVMVFDGQSLPMLRDAIYGTNHGVRRIVGATRENDVTTPDGKKVSQRRLLGPGWQQLTDIKKLIQHRARSGRAYVYREGPGAARISISDEEVVGFGELVACYDVSVTTPMLREDLYGICADE